MKSSNGNEDIVKTAIAANKQAASLKEAAIAKLLEQRNQIDADLIELGYQITPPVTVNTTESTTASVLGITTTFPPYAGGLVFTSISKEIKRRATIISRQTGVIYDTAVDRVIEADEALKKAYGSCA